MSSLPVKSDHGSLLLAVMENAGLAVVVVDQQERIAFASESAVCS